MRRVGSSRSRLATIEVSALSLASAIVAIAAWLTTPIPAQARAPGPDASPTDDVRLEWDAPKACPSREAVLEELAAYRVGQARRVDPVNVSVDVDLTGTGPTESWSARVRMSVDGDRIERRFTAESCEIVASGVALLVAVAVDPGRMSEEVEPAEVAPAEAAPELEPEPEPAPKPEPEPELKPAASPELARRDLAAIVGVSGGASWGDLPRVGPLVQATAGMSIDAFRWSIDGRFGFAREAVAVTEPRTAGAALAMWTLGARGCYVVSPRRVRVLQFPLCAGADGGQIFGQGVGLETNRRVRATYGDALLSGAIGVLALRGLALTLTAEGFVSLARPSFRIDDYGLVHRPAAGGARLWLGVEFHLGNNRWARRPKGR